MASEVLKLATFRGDAASAQALLTVAAGHTYTILSATICETAGNAENVQSSTNKKVKVSMPKSVASQSASGSSPEPNQRPKLWAKLEVVWSPPQVRRPIVP